MVGRGKYYILVWYQVSFIGSSLCSNHLAASSLHTSGATFTN